MEEERFPGKTRATLLATDDSQFSRRKARAWLLGQCPTSTAARGCRTFPGWLGPSAFRQNQPTELQRQPPGRGRLSNTQTPRRARRPATPGSLAAAGHRAGAGLSRAAVAGPDADPRRALALTGAFFPFCLQRPGLPRPPRWFRGGRRRGPCTPAGAARALRPAGTGVRARPGDGGWLPIPAPASLNGGARAQTQRPQLHDAF